MSISYVDAGAVVAGTTSAAVAYPAGIAAGDILILAAVNKYSAYTSAPPTGFTLLAERIGGSGGTGADVGNVRTAVWYRIADGTETGTVSVTKATETGTVILARMLLYERTSGYGWAVVGESGTSSTGTTSWSAVGSNDISIKSGDVVLAVTGVNTDAASWGSHVMAATGCTFSLGVERQDSGTTNGHDVRLMVSEHPCTAGPSSTFPTYTAIGSTGTPDGATVFVRLIESYGVTADHGSYTLSGQAAGLATGYRIAAEQGSHTLSGQAATLQVGSASARAWASGAWGSAAWAGTSWYGQGELSYTIPANYGTYALTGQAALFKQSRLAAQGSYTLTGQDATFRRGISMAAAQGSYALSGQAAGSSRTYAIAAAYGSYAQTGISAALYPGSTTGQAWIPDAWYVNAWEGTVWADNSGAPGAYSMSAATGYYSIGAEGSAVAWFENAWADNAWHMQGWTTGFTSTGLYRNRTMTAEVGYYTYTGDFPTYRDILLQTVPSIPEAAYVLTGQSVVLNRGISMTAAAGSYVLSGLSAGVLKGYRLSAAFGGYLSIGSDVEFVVGIGEHADAGYYTLTGQSVTFRRDYSLAAAAGVYTLAGQDVTLISGEFIIASQGAYVLTGFDATFSRIYSIVASTGYYTISGQVSGQDITEEVIAPTGGFSRRRKPRRLELQFPTPEEIQAEREALGILPKRKQKIIADTVKKATDVETEEQAAILASAYLQDIQQRKLMDTLRSKTAKSKTKWDDDMFYITHSMILDNLRKKADSDLLEKLLMEEEAEAMEINKVMELWLEL